MIRLLALLPLISLTGCFDGMSYEDVKQQSNYCVSKNMKAQAYQNLGSVVYKVRCIDEDGAMYKPKGSS